MLSSALIALAALAAAPAAAADRTWPTPADGWRLDVRVPAGPGQMRYSSVVAVPAGAMRWDVHVECGVHESASGRILERHVGRGRGEMARWPGMDGTYDCAVAGSYVIDLPPEDELAVHSQFTDARCASGLGQLSSGN